MHQAVEIRREYVRRITKLKLWAIRRLCLCEGLDFEAAANQRVGIHRMTVFWADQPGDQAEALDRWRRLLAELQGLFDRCRAREDSERFEAEGLELLWPHLAPAIERDVAENEAWLARAIGCFQYEFRPFYAASADSEDHLTLHVRNAHQPDSPFHHLPEMAASLREIVARAEAERPDVRRVQCATWLNSLPPFAGLFPEEWAATARPGVPGDHSGWWGQFMDRRGGFHERNARRFRDTGRFPFTHLLCRCALPELRRHLGGPAGGHAGCEHTVERDST